MKKRSSLTCLLVMVFTALMGIYTLSAHGNALTPLAPSKIDVFPEGAFLYFEVPPGETNVILPPSIDPNSISVHPDNGVNIIKLERDMIFLDQWFPPELEALRDQISLKLTQISETESQLYALRQSAKILENTVLPLDTSKGMKIIEELQKERYDIEQKVCNLEIKLEEQKAGLKILQNRWNELRPKNDFAANIKLSSSGKGKITIRAFSSEAGWQPLYYANYDSQKGALTLDLKAEIMQKTGIPWKGEIKLYTNPAQNEVELPELPPLIVEFREPISIKSLSTKAEDFAQEAIARKESLPGLVYTIKDQVSGTGTPTILPLERYNGKVDAEIICLPQIDSQAWIIAQTSPLDKSLLEGKVYLSIDHTPTGITTIQTTSMGESLRLSMGRVPLVMAKKEALIPKSGEKWTKGTLVDGYDIHVVNGLSSEITVSVIDRIPVSTHQDIKVDVINIDPKPTEMTQKGLYTWNLKLKQGEEKTITVKYEITYPENREIIIHPTF